ncbi:M56 family metallopeptidase [Sphingobacterium wenxiniae]|uniref:TonB-dependent outer membrane receptor, SusC/RagA subfamily, signature region n=1 Tax=Sphingobacterium wenxiniae TaxID=683125 RepID=A0A1I6VA44_9SPHI|nr:M56 family metallopeptidase [Sphingobacterium wenxiniae]SFT10586.1 TonB-dependent outer membrane receptor, SusC/RagA subfamily, signature region [Sphingobacterium wenxiniae]
MDSLLTYIVQVNILLGVVYIGYYALLKSLTFYQLNRLYFLLGGAFSLIYPFLDIRSWFQRHVEPVGELVDFLPMLPAQEVISQNWTIETVLYVTIGAGAIFLFGKLLLQLLSLLRIHLHSVEDSWKAYIYRNVLFPIVPFSFFNRIYLNKEQHQDVELYDIFEHEDIHVKGLHTVDVLFFELLLSVCWYNPLVWLMRKAVRQNLEFLTDQQVLNKGVDKQSYQYSLLNVSKQGVAVGVSNQFNFKLLKKRISMMNKKRSSKLELSKYAFILPLVIFAAGAFTVSKADGKITEVVELARETEVAVIKNMLQKPDTAKLVFVAEDGERKVFEARPTSDSSRQLGQGRYILDGKEVSFKEIKQLKAEDIESVSVNFDAKNKDDKFPDFGDIKETAYDYVNIKTKSYTGTLVPSGQFSRIVLRKNSIEEPLFIVDGQRKAKGYNINDIQPDDIESIHVWKDETAVVKFGSDAKDGVVEITLKDKKNPTVTVKAFGEKKKAEERELSLSNGKILGFGMRQDSTLNKVRISSFRVKGVGENGSPLIIIDGVEKDDKTLQKIDPNSIESVTVLRDESAAALYGSKGKDGVLLITTKKNKDSGKEMKEIVVVGKKAEVSIAAVDYSDDDTFFIDGKAVSKNEFKAVPEEKIEWKIGSGKKEGKGTKREIHTKK